MRERAAQRIGERHLSGERRRLPEELARALNCRARKVASRQRRERARVGEAIARALRERMSRASVAYPIQELHCAEPIYHAHMAWQRAIASIHLVRHPDDMALVCDPSRLPARTAERAE